MRQRRMGMPLRWKTSGLLGSRRANAATNRQSAANRALISRLLGVNRPFIGCEGARQRFTHVAEPFADTFLLGDVTVTYDHVQPRLARRPPRARLRGGASHEAEGRRGARGGGAGRVGPPATRRRLCVGQTSGATQRCLNLGFSERIGNSRRTGVRSSLAVRSSIG